MRAAHSQGLEQIDKVRAQDHLTGAEITQAVEENGWHILRHMSYARESAPIVARMGPLPQVRPEMAEPPADDPSGVYFFERP
jgi:hypothetical protein